tara:strand:- start:398 stop:829 length:432 start_codon:yes stop_codon:yes gene_type:complete
MGQMQLQLALVCDHAEQTPEGKLDIQGVFNDLAAVGFPAKHDMVLVLVVEWDHADRGRHDFQVDLVGPSGHPTMTVQGHSDVDPRKPDRPPARTRMIMPLREVIFPKKGIYSFRIRLKGRTYEGPSLYLMESETQEPTRTPST